MKILFDMDKKVIKINEAKIREMVAKRLKSAMNENSLNTLTSKLQEIASLLRETEFKIEEGDYDAEDASTPISFARHCIEKLIKHINGDNDNRMNMDFDLGDDYSDYYDN